MAMIRTYLWPFGAYRNAASGSELERAAAWRHNRDLSRALPRYINRWGLISSLLLIASERVPGSAQVPVAVAFSLAFCVTAHLAQVYLLFRRGQDTAHPGP